MTYCVLFILFLFPLSVTYFFLLLACRSTAILSAQRVNTDLQQHTATPSPFLWSILS